MNATVTDEPVLTVEEMANTIGVTTSQIEAAALQKDRIAELRKSMRVSETGAIMGIAGADAMGYE